MEEEKKKEKPNFPSSRIKKIMQSDQDVGKVAKGSLVVMSVCLGLFLDDLMKNLTEEAEKAKMKKISMQMLKNVVETEEKFDFLQGVVGKIEESSGGEKKKRSVEKDHDDNTSEKKKMKEDL